MQNVLIVDDSKFIRTIAEEEILRVVDANIVTAASYKETQAIIKEHAFHVAVLDVHLPDAEKGEVIDLLVEKNVPVVVLTGGMNATTKEIILNKEIIEYVTKSDPQTIKYMAAIVKRVLKNYDEHVLIVDDSKSSRMLSKMYLEKLKVNVLEASSAKEAMEMINATEHHVSLVLTDYEMPDMNGMELAMQLRQSYSKDQLSIIAVSGTEMSHIATDFLRHGANDFIKKPFTYEEFAVRVNVNLELIDLFIESKESANKDFMTGLYNRRFFFESGEPLLAKAQRKKRPLAVVMLDIDFFKRVNDTYGHDVGDIAIKEVGKVLHKMLRQSDLIARFGGEEFCLLLEDVTLEDLEKKFEAIRAVFEKNVITVDDVSFSYTISTGICYGLDDSLETLIKYSDEALYDAKEGGRNRVVIKNLHTGDD
ncbi:MAG: diguanylate cyclase [Campylobacterota bacterium]|nr:diguanylate cyclase [Campylobacterota bacterium]